MLFLVEDVRNSLLGQSCANGECSITFLPLEFRVVWTDVFNPFAAICFYGSNILGQRGPFGQRGEDMDVIRSPSNRYWNPIKAFNNTSNIGKDTFEVSLHYGDVATLCMEYEVHVDFNEGTSHCVVLFSVTPSGFIYFCCCLQGFHSLRSFHRLPVFCCPFGTRQSVCILSSLRSFHRLPVFC